MVSHFSPRRLLRQISNQQLLEFFNRRGQRIDPAWNNLSETEIEQIVSLWQGLPEAERSTIQAILQDIHELSSAAGLGVLAEEIVSKHSGRIAGFSAQTSYADKAMWVYLNLPEVFSQAMVFARADALSRGRYWITCNTVPHHPLHITPDTKKRFRTALADFYWKNQLRGSHVHVEYHRRSHGNEHFCVYCDDYADRHLVFNDGGQLDHHTARLAFENLFVFDPPSGMLSLYARGGKKVQLPLLKIFCRTMLDIELGPMDPARPVFQLDHLLGMTSLRRNPAIGVDDASILMLTVERRDIPGYRITLETNASIGSPTIHEMVQRHVMSRHCPVDRWSVPAAKLRLKCRSKVDGRARTATISVRCPCWCDLKSRPDDVRVIGEHCLKLWGIERTEPLDMLWPSMETREPQWTNDTIARWPAGTFEQLRRAGLLQLAETSPYIVCPNCHRQHAAEMLWQIDATGQRKTYIVCPEAPRLEVSSEDLRCWTIDFDCLARSLANAMALSTRVKSLLPSRLWRLGRTRWQNTIRDVVLARGLFWPDGVEVTSSIGSLRKLIVLIGGDVPPIELWHGRPPVVVSLPDVVTLGQRGFELDQIAMVAAIQEADEANRRAVERPLDLRQVRRMIRQQITAETECRLTDDAMVAAYHARSQKSSSSVKTNICPSSFRWSITGRFLLCCHRPDCACGP
jgi:hypothetical protein